MEYGILNIPVTLGNPTSNAIWEWIQPVIGNLVLTYNIIETYIYEDYPWSSILVTTAFAIFSTENSLKGYIPGQLVFCFDIILLTKHTVNWVLILQ